MSLVPQWNYCHFRYFRFTLILYIKPNLEISYHGRYIGACFLPLLHKLTNEKRNCTVTFSVNTQIFVGTKENSLLTYVRAGCACSGWWIKSGRWGEVRWGWGWRGGTLSNNWLTKPQHPTKSIIMHLTKAIELTCLGFLRARVSASLALDLCVCMCAGVVRVCMSMLWRCWYKLSHCNARKA